MGAVPRLRRLVLLTAEFPVDRGDVSFVSHEIAELARRFDEVLVFNRAQSRCSGRMAELPAGVRFVDSLPSRRALSRLWRVVPVMLRAGVIRMLWAEYRQGMPRQRLRVFLFTCIAGARLADEPELRRAVRQRGVDVTVYSFWGVGLGHVLPWLPRTSGGVVLRLHRGDLYEDAAGYLPNRWGLFRSARAILVVSEHGRRHLLDRYRSRPFRALQLEEKSVVSRLGTTDPGLIARRERGPVRTVVSCSFISAFKRVDLILLALEDVAATTRLRWVHFGGGPLADDLAGRAASAQERGIDIDLRGQVPNPEVLEFYRSNRVDAFVNASESEGVPVSLMEAMSFGIPVVATDVGGTGEIVGEELGSGRLLPAVVGPEQLAAAILDVLERPDTDFRAREVWATLCNAAVTAPRAADLVSATPHPAT